MTGTVIGKEIASLTLGYAKSQAERNDRREECHCEELKATWQSKSEIASLTLGFAKSLALSAMT